MFCCGDPGDCSRPCEQQLEPWQREFFERWISNDRVVFLAVPRAPGKLSLARLFEEACGA